MTIVMYHLPPHSSIFLLFLSFFYFLSLSKGGGEKKEIKLSPQNQAEGIHRTGGLHRTPPVKDCTSGKGGPPRNCVINTLYTFSLMLQGASVLFIEVSSDSTSGFCCEG